VCLSSDNLPSYLQTNTIAQILSIRGERTQWSRTLLRKTSVVWKNGVLHFGGIQRLACRAASSSCGELLVHLVILQAKNHILILITSPRWGAKYCRPFVLWTNKRIRIRIHISRTKCQNFTSHSVHACYLWPWLDYPLTIMQKYAMYFRFCGGVMFFT